MTDHGAGAHASVPRCSPACERNAPAIGAVLSDWLDADAHLLEVGSGTGQHAAYLIDSLAGVRWQPSDRGADVASMDAWRATASDSSRIGPAIELDVTDTAQWARSPRFDVLFTANTLHIMPWPACEALFAHAATHIDRNGLLCVYGPFHDDGQPTSDSNARFDSELRGRQQGMGIRDLQQVRALAARCDWLECAHYQMPANNQMLVWRRAQP